MSGEPVHTSEALATGRRAKVSGYSLVVWCKAQINVALQIDWRIRHEVSPKFKELADIDFASEALSKGHGGEGVKSHLEFCDDTEVAAASAKSPKQVGVLARVAMRDRAVGGNEGEAFDVIA